MPPNLPIIHELQQPAVESDILTKKKRYIRPQKFRWHMATYLLVNHIIGIYGLYQFIYICKWPTAIWTIFLHSITVVGTTAGLHRMWTHRAFKATVPLRIFFTFCTSLIDQGSVYKWACAHRVHHKFSETSADPYPARFGLFFSHYGWICYNRHPDFFKKLDILDTSDMLDDPVVYYDNKYYDHLKLFRTYLFSALVPWYFWNEPFWVALTVATFFRQILTWNCMFTGNSIAHSIGTKPYDKTITATDNMLCILLTFGEGYHNFHHVFPMDYQGCEWKNYHISPTTIFVDIMKQCGMIYDCKITSPEIIRKRKLRTGE